MKKLLVSIIAFLYITSTCEATVYLHYCMGKAVSVSFMPDRTGNCAKCGMKKTGKKQNCCKDEEKTVGTDKNQKLPDPAFQFSRHKTTIPVLIPFAPVVEDVVQSSATAFFSCQGPPGSETVPLYIRNRLLLI